MEETIGLSQKCNEEILYFGNYAFSLQTVSPNWNGSQRYEKNIFSKRHIMPKSQD